MQASPLQSRKSSCSKKEFTARRVLVQEIFIAVREVKLQQGVVYSKGPGANLHCSQGSQAAAKRSPVQVFIVVKSQAAVRRNHSKRGTCCKRFSLQARKSSCSRVRIKSKQEEGSQADSSSATFRLLWNQQAATFRICRVKEVFQQFHQEVFVRCSVLMLTRIKSSV